MVGPSLPWVDPLVDPALTLTSQTLHVPVTVKVCQWLLASEGTIGRAIRPLMQQGGVAPLALRSEWISR